MARSASTPDVVATWHANCRADPVTYCLSAQPQRAGTDATPGVVAARRRTGYLPGWMVSRSQAFPTSSPEVLARGRKDLTKVAVGDLDRHARGLRLARQATDLPGIEDKGGIVRR